MGGWEFGGTLYQFYIIISHLFNMPQHRAIMDYDEYTELVLSLFKKILGSVFSFITSIFKVVAYVFY